MSFWETRRRMSSPSPMSSPVKTTSIMGYINVMPMYITSIAFFIMGILIIFINGFGQSKMMLSIVWTLVILWAFVLRPVLRMMLFQNNDKEAGYNFAFTLLVQLVTSISIFIAVAMTVTEMGRSVEVHPFDTTMVMVICLLALIVYGLKVLMDMHAIEKYMINMDYYFRNAPKN